MLNINKDTAKFLLKQSGEDALIFDDGHAIYPIVEYKNWDKLNIVEDKDWEDLEVTFQSGNDHKSTIYNNSTGEPMESLKGIYNLDFLHFVCQKLGISNSTMVHGRGTEARILSSRIYSKLEEIAKYKEGEEQIYYEEE